MKAKKRASGGKVDLVSGNPNVIAEARAKRKDGGKVVKKNAGGKIVGLMSGGAVKQRMDRPGRKMGGRVGANTAPLSTAHNTTSAPSTPKSQQGGAS